MCFLIPLLFSESGFWKACESAKNQSWLRKLSICKTVPVNIFALQYHLQKGKKTAPLFRLQIQTLLNNKCRWYALYSPPNEQINFARNLMENMRATCRTIQQEGYRTTASAGRSTRQTQTISSHSEGQESGELESCSYSQLKLQGPQIFRAQRCSCQRADTYSIN